MPVRVVSRQLALSAALIVAGAAVHAAQIATSIEGPSRSATMSARRADGSADRLQWAVSVPGTAELPLPEGLWEIRAAGNELWSAPVYLRNAGTATIRLWPTATLTGTLNGVTALRARFTAADADSPAGEAACDVLQASWTCRIPEGVYDLRFSSPGAAPEFRLAVPVPSEGLRLQFVPGASLSGRVEAARGSRISVEGAEVSLGEFKARTDRKGFFQFKGLPPGDYSIAARKKTLITQSQPVKIIAGTAAELNAPLLLDTPRRLTVTVMPPFDPAGKPWTVRLFTSDAKAPRADLVAQSHASASGEWSYFGLVAGDYEIDIRTADGGLWGDGARWKSQPVTIGSDDVVLTLAALPMMISGKITIGGRPLRAALSFGGEGGPKLESDDDGRFTGAIPPAEGNERLIFIEAEAPHVRRTLTVKIGENDLRIDLPATSLTGHVTSVDRSPAPHATVTITRDSPDVFEQAFTQEDGSFEIAGFETGTYRITAEDFERESVPMSIDLKKDEPTDVELVLEPTVRLRGRMTAGDSPVIAAEIHVFPRNQWRPMTPSARTNENGLFQVSLPAGATVYDGIAVHPAFDTVIGRGTIQEGKHAVIRTRQIGGTLIVESKQPAGLVLVHNGAEMPLTTVAHLAEGVVAAERVIVPRMEPGHYAVCSKAHDCVSGDLPPYGTLTIPR